MKKNNILLLFLMALSLSVSAQDAKKVCFSGITFEVSNNPSWGYGEPVVLHVEPYSPAARAGIKVNDILMEINGAATYYRNYPTIESWLNNSTTRDIKVTVRNLETYFKEFEIARNCGLLGQVSESQLASEYSFYSMENTVERAFSLPLNVRPFDGANYSDYRTFKIVSTAKYDLDVEQELLLQVQTALEQRGLVVNNTDPDMLVQVYFDYESNLKYTYAEKNIAKSWRYNPHLRQMVQLPILSAGDPEADLRGRYKLDLGIRFYDNKFIESTAPTQIWDCNVREFLTDEMTLEDYAKIHVPLMLMQYPYASTKAISKYVVSFKKFNYTGINYDAHTPNLVASVDEGSAADQAGIKAGDYILKINKHKLDYTQDQFNNGYRRFILETMNFRDPRTKFINADGFLDCMYWDKSKQQQVKSAFAKSYFQNAFSYLYAFEKYVADTNILQVEYMSGKTKRTVKLSPQIHNSVEVKAL